VVKEGRGEAQAVNKPIYTSVKILNLSHALDLCAVKQGPFIALRECRNSRTYPLLARHLVTIENDASYSFYISLYF